MARIRSVHPGQWDDEDFCECSPLARLLALALRNHADDHGVFDWKPRTLKVRCLPFDECDIEDLLEELTAHRQIMRFSLNGRAYGAIRNFCCFQRPKAPSGIGDLPEEIREYVALPSEGEPKKPGPKPKRSPNVPHPEGNGSGQGRKDFRTSSETVPAGEEGREDSDIEPGADAPGSHPPSGGQPEKPPAPTRRWPDLAKLPMVGKRFVYPKEFEAFWSAWQPALNSNDSKESAYRHWRKPLVKGTAEPGDLQAGAEAHAGSQAVADGYLCHVSTWINNHRWTASYEQRHPAQGLRLVHGGPIGGGRGGQPGSMSRAIAERKARRRGAGLD